MPRIVKKSAQAHSASYGTYTAEGQTWSMLPCMAEAQGTQLHRRQTEDFFNSINPKVFLYECWNRKEGKHPAISVLGKLSISHSRLSADIPLVVDYFALVEHCRGIPLEQ